MKKRRPPASLTITKEPQHPAEVNTGPKEVALTERLKDIRDEALRDRSHTSQVIARLQSQREQLDEMCADIDATIAFLRAQRRK